MLGNAIPSNIVHTDKGGKSSSSFRWYAWTATLYVKNRTSLKGILNSSTAARTNYIYINSSTAARTNYIYIFTNYEIPIPIIIHAQHRFWPLCPTRWKAQARVLREKRAMIWFPDIFWQGWFWCSISKLNHFLRREQWTIGIGVCPPYRGTRWVRIQRPRLPITLMNRKLRMWQLAAASLQEVCLMGCHSPATVTRRPHWCLIPSPWC